MRRFEIKAILFSVSAMMRGGGGTSWGARCRMVVEWLSNGGRMAQSNGEFERTAFSIQSFVLSSLEKGFIRLREEGYFYTMVVKGVQEGCP